MNPRRTAVTINHLFDTNTFIINYRDELISLKSNSTLSLNLATNTNNNEQFNDIVNDVKPKEEFSDYYCDVNPNFDNTLY